MTEEEDQPIRVRFPTLQWHREALRNWEKVPIIIMNGGIWTAKTSFATIKAIEMMEQHPDWLIWWIAGLEWQIDAMWSLFTAVAPQVGIRCLSSPYRRAFHPNGSRFMGVTAKNLELIAAYHPDFVFGDEWSKWRAQAWHLTRARMIRGDRGFFFSTPRGVPHYVDILSKAKDHQDKRRLWPKTWLSEDERYLLIDCDTIEAGIAGRGAIEALRKDLPWDMFRQEVLAQLVQGAGNVFRFVEGAAAGKALRPKDGERYTIGYDAAKTRDFAVMAVRKISTDAIVKMLRMRDVSYHAQARIVVNLSWTYNKAPVIFDKTGAGGHVVEEILRKTRYNNDPESGRPHYIGVTFDNAIKGQMVEDLVVHFEQRTITLPSVEYGDPYDVAVQELNSFERRRSGTGLVYQYDAPEGLHDDCVTAIGLAFMGGASRRGPISWIELSTPLTKKG